MQIHSFIRKTPLVLLTVVLLAGSLWWAAGYQGQKQAQGLTTSPGGPLLSGARFSSWQGSHRAYTLEINGLELIPKRLGPFKLGDSRDIKAQNCRLEVDAAALPATFQELGRTLVNLARPLASRRADAAGDDLNPRQALIVLPPKIVAAPFWGRIAFPHNAWLVLRADAATFDPQDPCLRLQGKVQVTASRGAALTAEEAAWELETARLLVPGRYAFQTGQRSLAGHRGQFSLAAGQVRLLKPAPEAPGLQETAGGFAMPVNLLLHAIPGKNLHGFENVLLPLLAAAQSGGAASPGMAEPPPAPWLDAVPPQ